MWKWGVILLAVLGIGVAAWQSFRALAPRPVPPLARPPVRNPYPHAIAASGILEPSSENVLVGAPEAGRVPEVLVVEGQTVHRGDPLFKLDTRDLDASRVSAQGALVLAQAQRDRVQAYRRSEEGPILEAQVQEAEKALGGARYTAQANQAAIQEVSYALQDLEEHNQRLEATVAAEATAAEDLFRSRFQASIARARMEGAKGRAQASQADTETAAARLSLAQANLALFRAGPWAADVQQAQAAVLAQQAELQRLDLLIERRTVRAPLDAVVLRVNLRSGEFVTVGAAQAQDAALVLGRIDPLHIRADIDEFDAARLVPGAAATAFLRGAPEHPIPLTFVRVVPLVMPKRTLSGNIQELVDTRVLQVLFKVDSAPLPLYAGQQVDVYIQTPQP